MAELYVDGQWVSARAGGRREIRCPADGTLVAEVDEAGCRRHRRRHRGRPPRLRARALAAAAVPRAGRPAAAGRRPARAGRRRGGADGVARHREAPRRGRVRRRRRGVGLPALRPRRRRGRRPGGRHRQRRRGQPDRARADRGLRPDHAVELPAAPGLLEGRAVPRRRQHVRPQAQRADAALRHPPDAAPRGGRAPAPGWATSCSGPAPTPVRRSPRTRGSTWSRSPGDSRPAAGSWPPPRRRSRRSRSSSAARTPTSSSPTPTSRWRSTSPSPRSSCTPGRCARPAPACWSRSRCTTSSSTRSWSGRAGSGWAARSTRRRRPGR